jgi:hypothetical protein
MSIASLLCVLLLLSVVSAQETKEDNPPQVQRKIPAAFGAYPLLQQMRSHIPPTLEEAHAQLERMLPRETLAEIDAMPSEFYMVKYHFSWGLTMRNGWGLWAGSPLATYMRELGCTHPDDMSGLILTTFWRKRHGQDLHLDELRAAAKIAAAAAQKAERERQKRIQEAKAALPKMMMGLRFEEREVPMVRMPVKTGLSVRFLSPFRGGVFLAAYGAGRVHGGGYVVGTEWHQYPSADIRSMEPRVGFFTMGFHFNLADRKMHRIRVAEIKEVRAAVVVGDKAWFTGITDGKPVLVGVGERDRIKVALPKKDEIPDLGMDGRSLLAVYSKTIYRLTNRKWTLIHSGEDLLPRSSLPPQRHGDMVFLRNEGHEEAGRQLWWLSMGQQSHLSALDQDVGAVGEVILRRTDSSSYCVTTNDDLWTCVGGASLLRRSQDGHYSIAILNGSVRFTENLLDSRKSNQGLSISAVTALPDDTLLLAGNAGLYRLRRNELVQELAFTVENTTDRNGNVLRWGDWNPSVIFVPDEQSYVIGSGSGNGVYLLRKDNEGQWKCLPLEDSRDIVAW